MVDDRSTDGTGEILRSHPDPRMRCIVLKKHAGAQAARNKSIHEARSEWIAFQDSDDEWVPDKLEKQVSVLARTDYDPLTFIYCNAIRFERTTGRKTVFRSLVIEGYGHYTTLIRSSGEFIL